MSRRGRGRPTQERGLGRGEGARSSFGDQYNELDSVDDQWSVGRGISSHRGGHTGVGREQAQQPGYADMEHATAQLDQILQRGMGGERGVMSGGASYTHAQQQLPQQQWHHDPYAQPYYQQHAQPYHGGYTYNAAQHQQQQQYYDGEYSGAMASGGTSAYAGYDSAGLDSLQQATDHYAAYGQHRSAYPHHSQQFAQVQQQHQHQQQPRPAQNQGWSTLFSQLDQTTTVGEVHRQAVTTVTAIAADDASRIIVTSTTTQTTVVTMSNVSRTPSSHRYSSANSTSSTRDGYGSSRLHYGHNSTNPSTGHRQATDFRSSGLAEYAAAGYASGQPQYYNEGYAGGNFSSVADTASLSTVMGRILDQRQVAAQPSYTEAYDQRAWPSVDTLHGQSYVQEPAAPPGRELAESESWQQVGTEPSWKPAKETRGPSQSRPVSSRVTDSISTDARKLHVPAAAPTSGSRFKGLEIEEAPQPATPETFPNEHPLSEKELTEFSSSDDICPATVAETQVKDSTSTHQLPASGRREGEPTSNGKHVTPPGGKSSKTDAGSKVHKAQQDTAKAKQGKDDGTEQHAFSKKKETQAAQSKSTQRLTSFDQQLFGAFQSPRKKHVKESSSESSGSRPDSRKAKGDAKQPPPKKPPRKDEGDFGTNLRKAFQSGPKPPPAKPKDKMPPMHLAVTVSNSDVTAGPSSNKPISAPHDAATQSTGKSSIQDCGPPTSKPESSTKSPSKQNRPAQSSPSNTTHKEMSEATEDTTGTVVKLPAKSKKKTKEKVEVASPADLARAKELLKYAVEAHKHNSLEQAVDLYTQSLQINGNVPVALYNRSSCFMKMRNIPMVIHDAQECVRLDPGYEKAFVRLAEASMEVFDVATARQSFMQAYKLKVAKKTYVESEAVSLLVRATAVSTHEASDAIFPQLIPEKSNSNCRHWHLALGVLIVQESWGDLAFLLAGVTAIEQAEKPARKRKFVQDPMSLLRYYPEIKLVDGILKHDTKFMGSLAGFVASKFSSHTTLHQLNRVSVDWNMPCDYLGYPLRQEWTSQRPRHDIILLMLSWGASPPTMFGFTHQDDISPLHAATYHALAHGNKAIPELQRMLKFYHDYNPQTAGWLLNDLGETPYHLACQARDSCEEIGAKVIIVLSDLDHGIDPHDVAGMERKKPELFLSRQKDQRRHALSDVRKKWKAHKKRIQRKEKQASKAGTASIATDVVKTTTKPHDSVLSIPAAAPSIKDATEETPLLTSQLSSQSAAVSTSMAAPSINDATEESPVLTSQLSSQSSAVSTSMAAASVIASAAPAVTASQVTAKKENRAMKSLSSLERDTRKTAVVDTKKGLAAEKESLMREIHRAIDTMDYEVDSELGEDDIALQSLQSNDPVAASIEGDASLPPFKEKNLERLNNSTWEIQCSPEFITQFNHRLLANSAREEIIAAVLKLAAGELQNDSCSPVKKVNEEDVSSLCLVTWPLCDGKVILVWQRTVAFSPRCSNFIEDDMLYAEVIRLWDILVDGEDVNMRLAHITRCYVRGRTSAVEKRLRLQAGNVAHSLQGGCKAIPKVFSEDSAPDFKQKSIKFNAPANADEHEYDILKFYSFTSTVAGALLHRPDTTNSCFPFLVTPKEQLFIAHDGDCSMLLLGRSGTGKTTVCLYRMWHHFEEYWLQTYRNTTGPRLPRMLVHRTTDQEEALEEPANARQHGVDDKATPQSAQQEEKYDHIHQLFITKNPVLCGRMHRNFVQLSQGSSDDVLYTHDNNLPLPHSLQGLTDKHFPLFLTSRQWLVLLDGSFPDPFFPRRDNGSPINGEFARGDQDGNEVLEDLPEDVELDELMEEDSGEGHGDGDEQEGKKVADDEDKAHDGGNARREVTYQVFHTELWRKVTNKEQRDRFHPLLVWTEIKSFIKGSFAALPKPHSEEPQNRFLSRREYDNLGRKMAANFSGDRSAVYDIFEAYHKEVRRRHWFDECDLVSHIYQRLFLPDWKISEQFVLHRLYVDEAQDFTQAELAVMLQTSHNPNRLFLTGDTAQSIMRGVHFRFKDLRSLFHEDHNSMLSENSSTCQRVAVPKIDHLCYNYRSHAGVLNLAASVVDLLSHFFREAFDSDLPRDKALFDGPRPVILQTQSVADLALVLAGNKRSGPQIEFGARQVILVQSADVKNSLPKEFAMALKMTIFEAKGLEFDDVLLYNFFSTSKANKTDWRVVTQYLEDVWLAEHPDQGQETSYEADYIHPRPLKFDKDKHKVLCSELKYLYTAITRSRVNVWLYDEDEECRAPVFDYFRRRQLVHVRSADSESLSDVFSKHSTPEEWENRGQYFLENNVYNMAAESFRRAGMTERAEHALGLAMFDKARKLPPAEVRRASVEFVRAAERFMFVKDYQLAARSLTSAREYKMAARVYEELDRVEKQANPSLQDESTQRFDKLIAASRLYEKAGEILDATRCLGDRGRYATAIDLLRKNGYHEKALVDYKRFNSAMLQMSPLQASNIEMPDQTLDELIYCVADHYLQQKRTADYKRVLADLKWSDQLNFLKDHNLWSEAISLLLAHDERFQAGELLQSTGEYLEAAKIFNEIGTPDAISACCKCFLLESTKSGDGKTSHLDEALKLAKKANNLQLQAEVQLEMDRIEEAMKLFGRADVRQFVGEVEAASKMKEKWRLASSYNCEHLCRLRRPIVFALRLSSLFLNGQSSEYTRMAEKYFEYSESSDGSVKLQYGQRSRLFLSKLATSVNPQALKVRQAIGKHFHSRARQLVEFNSGTVRYSELLMQMSQDLIPCGDCLIGIQHKPCNFDWNHLERYNEAFLLIGNLLCVQQGFQGFKSRFPAIQQKDVDVWRELVEVKKVESMFENLFATRVHIPCPTLPTIQRLRTFLEVQKWLREKIDRVDLDESWISLPRYLQLSVYAGVLGDDQYAARLTQCFVKVPELAYWNDHLESFYCNADSKTAIDRLLILQKCHCGHGGDLPTELYLMERIFTLVVLTATRLRNRYKKKLMIPSWYLQHLQFWQCLTSKTQSWWEVVPQIDMQRGATMVQFLDSFAVQALVDKLLAIDISSLAGGPNSSSIINCTTVERYLLLLLSVVLQAGEQGVVSLATGRRLFEKVRVIKTDVDYGRIPHQVIPEGSRPWNILKAVSTRTTYLDVLKLLENVCPRLDTSVLTWMSILKSGKLYHFPSLKMFKNVSEYTILMQGSRKKDRAKPSQAVAKAPRNVVLAAPPATSAWQSGTNPITGNKSQTERSVAEAPSETSTVYQQDSGSAMSPVDSPATELEPGVESLGTSVDSATDAPSETPVPMVQSPAGLTIIGSEQDYGQPLVGNAFSRPEALDQSTEDDWPTTLDESSPDTPATPTSEAEKEDNHELEEAPPTSVHVEADSILTEEFADDDAGWEERTELGMADSTTETPEVDDTELDDELEKLAEETSAEQDKPSESVPEQIAVQEDFMDESQPEEKVLECVGGVDFHQQRVAMQRNISKVHISPHRYDAEACLICGDAFLPSGYYKLPPNRRIFVPSPFGPQVSLVPFALHLQSAQHITNYSNFLQYQTLVQDSLAPKLCDWQIYVSRPLSRLEQAIHIRHFMGLAIRRLHETTAMIYQTMQQASGTLDWHWATVRLNELGHSMTAGWNTLHDAYQKFGLELIPSLQPPPMSHATVQASDRSVAAAHAPSTTRPHPTHTNRQSRQTFPEDDVLGNDTTEGLLQNSKYKGRKSKNRPQRGFAPRFRKEYRPARH